MYASAVDGIGVFAPDGEPIGAIELLGAVNFTFGGRERVLFVTADTAIWAVLLRAHGA